MNELWVIVGPTASGKSSLALSMASLVPSEIIAADSVQVYRYMNIGTAKPTPQEQMAVPHHMIDLVNPDTVYTVADYQKDAIQAILAITARGHTPIIVGGTGLYVQSILDGYIFSPMETDWEFRMQMEEAYRTKGAAWLHDQLCMIDPVSSDKIHPHDMKRIIRALEVHHTTGIPFSAQQRKAKLILPAHLSVRIYGVTMERKSLYQRIEDRVDQMMADGFLHEVEDLIAMGYRSDHYALQSLGYKQLMAYLNGATDLEQAVAEIKKETRHYAKRQYTWFRRDSRIHWISSDQFSSSDEIAQHLLANSVSSGE